MPASTKQDYYEVLGVSRDAKEDEIRKTFESMKDPDSTDDPDEGKGGGGKGRKS